MAKVQGRRLDKEKVQAAISGLKDSKSALQEGLALVEGLIRWSKNKIQAAIGELEDGRTQLKEELALVEGLIKWGESSAFLVGSSYLESLESARSYIKRRESSAFLVGSSYLESLEDVRSHILEWMVDTDLAIQWLKQALEHGKTVEEEEQRILVFLARTREDLAETIGRGKKEDLRQKEQSLQREFLQLSLAKLSLEGL